MADPPRPVAMERARDRPSRTDRERTSKDAKGRKTTRKNKREGKQKIFRGRWAAYPVQSLEPVAVVDGGRVNLNLQAAPAAGPSDACFTRLPHYLLDGYLCGLFNGC